MKALNGDGQYKQMHLALGISFFAVVILSAAQIGFASSYAPQALADTVKAAPVIVRGLIVGDGIVQDVVSSEGVTVPFTYYTFNVTEVIKGDVASSPIIIRQLGEDKPRVKEDYSGQPSMFMVAGAPSFEDGEEVVVMLHEINDDGSYDVRGLQLGKMKVEHSANGTELITGTAIDADMMSQKGQDHVAVQDEYAQKGLAKKELNELRRLAHKP